MTRVHDEKYEAFGGNYAAFDPVSNLRVGVQVLKDCIARAGGLEAGLRYYVGAANLGDDGGYALKVLAEQAHLRMVATGKSVSPNVPLIIPGIQAAASSPAPNAAAAGIAAETLPAKATSDPQAKPEENNQRARIALLEP